MTLWRARDVRYVNAGPGERIVVARSATLERHVGGPAGETQLPVQGDGRPVLLVDVEHRLVKPATAEVPQAGEGQRPAQADAVRGRVDAEHVDLADRLVIMAGVAVHFRPVEPDEVTGPLRPQEPFRVEPGLGHPDPQVVQRPSALVRVLRERAGVERDPALLVGTGPERTQGDARRQYR